MDADESVLNPGDKTLGEGKKVRLYSAGYDEYHVLEDKFRSQRYTFVGHLAARLAGAQTTGIPPVVEMIPAKELDERIRWRLPADAGFCRNHGYSLRPRDM